MSEDPTASSSEYEDGLAFRFRFPTGTNLSLRAVDIKDGVPKLRFTAALKVPTITEEDVAICVRLCSENKRPEFFYESFPLGHPFFNTGRLFKGYRPRYLRGTSVGELFAEADWIMKCLHVGVRSDEKKEKFWPWKETSNLEGLRSREDFGEDLPRASIIMTCKSVDVEESADELFFVGEPKMRIDCVDEKSNVEYSKYITEIFDSVAYYDEPRFLQVKEIFKLVLAVEWLQKKNVAFSRKWYTKLTEKPNNKPSKPIQVELSDQEAHDVFEMLLKEAKCPEKLALGDVFHPAITPHMRLLDQKVLKTGLQLKTETKLSLKAVAGPQNITGYQTSLTATFNDYDLLCDGLDPNAPTDIDYPSLELLTPNVKSWNELFCETVPKPCAVLKLPGGFRSPPLTGGVSTSSIPQRKMQAADDHEEVTIPASVSAAVQKPLQVPTQKVVSAPRRDVGVETELSQSLKELRAEKTAGMITDRTLATSDGTNVPSLKLRKDTLSQRTGQSKTEFLELPLPPLDIHQPPNPANAVKGSPTSTDSGFFSPPSLLSPTPSDVTVDSEEPGNEDPKIADR